MYTSLGVYSTSDAALSNQDVVLLGVFLHS